MEVLLEVSFFKLMYVIFKGNRFRDSMKGENWNVFLRFYKML